MTLVFHEFQRYIWTPHPVLPAVRLIHVLYYFEILQYCQTEMILGIFKVKNSKRKKGDWDFFSSENFHQTPGIQRLSTLQYDFRKKIKRRKKDNAQTPIRIKLSKRSDVPLAQLCQVQTLGSLSQDLEFKYLDVI